MMPNDLSLKNMNQWALVAFALVGFIVGYGLSEIMNAQMPAAPAAPSVAADPTPSPTPTPPPPAAVPVAEAADADDDPFLGEEDAEVTLIEFTDYQCPFCGRHYKNTFEQIKKNYVDTGKIKYVLRDYPLGFHKQAQKASEATECADDQGKFWEMHSMLFENQQSLEIDALKGYAKDLELNESEFNDCLDSGKYEEEVKKDFNDGRAAGITGTPGFILLDKEGKGSKISGAQPFSSFQSAIDAAL